MPKLILNYMRLLAVFLLTLLTLAIIISYYLIPKVFAVSLADFYNRYWHLLNVLFVLTSSFLVFAFYAERQQSTKRWLNHIIALFFVLGVIYEGINFAKAGTLLFALIS